MSGVRTGDGRYGFRLVSVDHELEVVDFSGMTFHSNHRLALEALRPGVRFFERRYLWTGSGAEGDPVFQSGRDNFGHQLHRLHGPIVREESRRILLIDLGHDFDEGERVEVAFSQAFIDTGKTFQPRLGTSARDNVERIQLRVKLPENYSQDVFSEEGITGQAKRSDRSRMVADREEDGRRVFEWDVAKPVDGMSYRITWTL